MRLARVRKHVSEKVYALLPEVEARRAGAGDNKGTIVDSDEARALRLRLREE